MNSPKTLTHLASSPSPRRTRSRAALPWLLIAAVALAACSDDSSSETSDTGTPTQDMGVGGDQSAGVDQAPAGDQGGGVVELPPVPQQSGVAYVAHYDSTELFFYRTDGDAPVAAGQIDLGARTHNLELDPVNDRLYVVSDTANTISIYQLSRPQTPSDPVTPPALVSTIDTDLLPMFARVNPYRHRLYVVAAIDGENGQSEFSLLGYDVTDPANPQPLTGWPKMIPATASLALDGARQVLFVLGLLTEKIHAFDLAGDELAVLAGEPFDVRAAYPGEHQVGWSAQGLTVDIYRNRLYGARNQSVLSELIALEYPADLPAAGQRYGELASHADLTVLADPFEVDKDIEQRPTIYAAHIPAVDLERGHILLSAAGWKDMYTPGIFVAITKDLALAAGCNDLDGFGCWFNRYSGTEPITELGTGGAACVDYTHKVAVGTSVEPGHDNVNSFVNMFRYADDLTMTPWLPAAGGNLDAGTLPITAVCH